MRAGRIWTGLMAAAVIALPSLRAAAEQMIVSGRATSIAEQRNALREANAQAADAHARSRELEIKAANATAEADKVNARAAALAARIQESEAQLRAGQARIAIIGRLIAAQSQRLAEQQGPLIRLTAALQSLSRRPPVLALLQPGSLTDTVHVRAVFAQLLPIISARTASLRTELARARDLRSMAVAADRTLKASKLRLADQHVQLQRLETQKRLAARGLTSSATIEAERATAMGERALDIGDLMQQLTVAGDLRERLASLPGPELRPAAPDEAPMPVNQRNAETEKGPPAYRLPVVGILVTGMGELSDSGMRARGIGIATQPGAQVVAPAQGRIAFAGPYRGFGQIVIIDHGSGWSSLITNLGRISADVGQPIAQGDPIGTAAIGNSPVITVELRRQSRPVDIVAIMNAPAK